MDVREIQSKVAEAYASFQSFRDHGTQTTTFIKGPKPHQRRTSITEFSVEFVRPFSLVAEEAERAVGPRDEWRRQVVWTRGDDVHLWSTLEPERATLTDSLGFGLSSMHLAASLLRLLLPETARGGSIANLSAEALGESQIAGLPCWKIGIRYPKTDGAEIAWIDSKDFLLHRIEETRAHSPVSQAKLLESLETLSAKSQEAVRAAEIIREGMRRQSPEEATYTTTTVTDYHPEVNPHIDPATLTFTPP